MNDTGSPCRPAPPAPPARPTGPPVGEPAGPRWSARTRGVLTVLCAVVFLDGLDVSMVGVALPAIGSELGLPAASLPWVTNAYLLGYGGLLLLGGRTTDLLGRRVVLLVALGAFAAASLVGGLVDDGVLLIAARFVKGAAAAFSAPAALSLLTTHFARGPSRNRAMSVFAVFGAVGYSSGLVFGGLLTTVDWRWTFLVPVPLAVAALLAGAALLRRDEPAAGGGYDLVGAVTSTAAMLLTVHALVSVPDRGLLDPVTLGSAVLAGVLLVGFVAAERRAAQSLVRLGILRGGPVLRADLSVVALFGPWVSFLFVMTLHMQDVLRWSPLQVALALLPGGLVVALGAPFAGRWVDRYGTAPLVTCSMAAASSGYVWFLATAGADPPYATTVLPTTLLVGAGFAFGFGAILEQATEGVDPAERGMAAGLVQASGQIGAAVVLAVVTALGAGGAVAGDPVGLDRFRPGLVVVTGVALAGLLLNLLPLLVRRGARG